MGRRKKENRIGKTMPSDTQPIPNIKKLDVHKPIVKNRERNPMGDDLKGRRTNSLTD